MRYVVDIDGTICIPGPTDETRYDQALPIQDRIDEINKLYDEGPVSYTHLTLPTIYSV